MASPEIKVAEPSLFDRTCVDEIVVCAKMSIAARGRFSIALSGGSTPRPIYSLLADDQRDPGRRLPWNKVHIFFGDERHVPPADPDSNFRMANEALISRIPIPAENVHRIEAELNAETAAERYEAALKKFFSAPAGEWPRFDLILLGIGPEGHTASLFPGSPALKEKTRWVTANWVEKLKTQRITFTYPVLNHAAEIMFMVKDGDKAAVVKKILKEPASEEYPASRVQPENGRLLWLLAKPVAALL